MAARASDDLLSQRIDDVREDMRAGFVDVRTEMRAGSSDLCADARTSLARRRIAPRDARHRGDTRGQALTGATPPDARPLLPESCVRERLQRLAQLRDLVDERDQVLAGL